MRIHKTTFGEVVRMRCTQNGLNDEAMARRTGVCLKTFRRHVKDEQWSIVQLQQLHRYLHFTVEDIEVLLDGRLMGSNATNEAVVRLVDALVPALQRYGTKEDVNEAG